MVAYIGPDGRADRGARDMPTFPLPFKPQQSYHDAPRKFGASRSGGRKHAGCDLYAPVGTEIRAMADGRVIQGIYEFYDGTSALEVDHGTFVARYGEISGAAPGIAAGTEVKAGDVIAYVGKLDTIAQSMLHLELYDGSARGPLTQRDRPPYMRRADLIDPTPILDAAG